jgi:hypothetical protein
MANNLDIPGLRRIIASLLELEAARDRILSLLPPPGAEIVPLAQAQGRILAETIRSAVELPGFDNSAMDGYAVRSADLKHAAVAAPVPLRLRGRAAAGEVFPGELAAGECLRVFTGSPARRCRVAPTPSPCRRTPGLTQRNPPWFNSSTRPSLGKMSDFAARI